jgi:threonine synthase
MISSEKSANYVSGLHCVRCGARYPQYAPNNDLIFICATCGGNCLVDYHLDKIQSIFSRQTLEKSNNWDIWRYRPLLPLTSRGAEGPPVGWTPLIEAPKLSRSLGVNRILIKDEGRNPSASLKDRASLVALLKARELGHDLVTAASTGNAASATAVLAAAMGIRTRIFVPRSAPPAKIAQLLTFGAEVLAVDGTYDQAFELCLAASRKYGWYNRNTGYNPYTREGKKTVAFEICEQLSWQVPDLVVVPVGDGNIMSGVWKGFVEFQQLGLIDRTPKLLAVQAEGSAAIIQAFQGNGNIQAVSGTTVADSISVSYPRDGEAAVHAIRDSGGMGISVSDLAILQAIGEVAKGAGVFAEPAAAAAFAGFKKAVEQGIIDPDWTVVLLITGNGLKDVASAMRYAGEPKIIAPDPNQLVRIFPQ